MTLSITTLILQTLCIMNDTSHYSTQHNSIQLHESLRNNILPKDTKLDDNILRI
jgi:hypothetical protein